MLFARIEYQNRNQNQCYFYYILLYLVGSTQEYNSQAWVLNSHIAATIQDKVNKVKNINKLKLVKNK